MPVVGNEHMSAPSPASASSSGVTTARVAANGLHFRVLQAGPESAPLVLLLHGFPEGALCWRHQVGVLAAAGWRVWAPDQRGYGQSDRPVGSRNYRLSLLAADAFGLMDAAGVVSARVVGHDWGGAVAWWMARARPDRVDRLAILNCPHPSVMRRALRTNPRQILRSWYIAFFQLPWLPEAILGAGRGAALARGLRTSGRRAKGGSGGAGAGGRAAFSAGELEGYRREWARPGALRAMIDWYRALRHPVPAMGGGVRGEPKIVPPTLLLWGRRDRALGAELARSSLERCADARLVFLDEATHWLQHEEPERVNAELLEHLAGPPAAA